MNSFLKLKMKNQVFIKKRINLCKCLRLKTKKLLNQKTKFKNQLIKFNLLTKNSLKWKTLMKNSNNKFKNLNNYFKKKINQVMLKN